MSYESGDDPRLVADLKIALKRWHRPTLGEAALATGLAGVERRCAADLRLTRASALQQMIRAGLAALRERDRAEHAALLERRYLREESVYLLAEAYHLSERSIYYRLEEALVALAHALWVLDQHKAGTVPDSVPAVGPSLVQWRARHLPPPTYTRLFGMEEVLAELLDCLNDPNGHWLISLDGMGGLGKTALARQAAGCLAETDRFADIAWLTIKPDIFPSRGPRPLEHPTLTCGQMLDAIASQLGDIDLGSWPLPAKRDRVHDLLHASSYLVVLDNLETVANCEAAPNWFRGLANPSKFLLTSRHRPEFEVGSSVLFLEPLAEHESLALIRHEGNLRGLREVAEASDEALRPIVAVTGGNPLAIRLVVGQLVSLPLSRALAAIETAQPGFDPFYQYLYRASWDQVCPPAQRLLLHMIQLPSSDATWEDLSAVSGLSDAELATAIADLTTHSLLQAGGLEEKIYSIHPLTHHFITGQALERVGIDRLTTDPDG